MLNKKGKKFYHSILTRQAAQKINHMNLSSFIDYTSLKPTTLATEVTALCKEAIQQKFAAVCVPPPFVKIAKGILGDTPVKVATAVGFPFGYSAVEAKLAEILLAMVDGADELDVVINFMAIKNNDWGYLANELNHILPMVKKQERILKVIIETGELTNDEIVKCCDLYGAAGVDYISTSTSFAEVGNLLDTVKLMRLHLASHVQIKATGGITTTSIAQQLVDAGASRLGCEQLLVT